MKKNLVPLLGIAFVVAILATAIFYGLMSSRMTGSVQAKAEHPSVTASGVAASGFGSVPVGLRAVSVQVADSSGILTVLQPGDRVDIQAVYSRAAGPNDIELKTVLQNIEVWKVSPQPEPSPGRHTLPVVTLLATPAGADSLALADAGARIRLALRNPEDREQTDRPGGTILSLMRSAGQPLRPTSKPRSAREPSRP